MKKLWIAVISSNCAETDESFQILNNTENTQKLQLWPWNEAQ